MIKPENNGMMVRGVVVVADRNSARIGIGVDGCITAYTHWFRHDEDLDILAYETDALMHQYMSFSKTSAVQVGYEYKGYNQ